LQGTAGARVKQGGPLHPPQLSLGLKVRKRLVEAKRQLYVVFVLLADWRTLKSGCVKFQKLV
jgi:hypothetical protein